MHNLTFGEFSKVPSLNEVIRLQEDLTQPRLANRIILQIELVETMERILVCVHVQGIDRKVIRREVQ